MPVIEKVALSIAALLITPLVSGLTPLDHPTGRANNGTAITNITSNAGSYPNGNIPRYEKLEITFSLSAIYQNPFDPALVRVDGAFTAPDNSVLVQPGFYYQDYTMTDTDGHETYTPTGNPVWKIRFSPRQAGHYQYVIKMTDGSGTTTTSASSFDVVESGLPGFIQVSSQNQRYFGFDNGRPFFGIGLNVAWWQNEQQRITTYAYYLSKMHDNKANLARVWMTNSGKDQNWIMSVQDKTLGAYYNLEKSWAFDRILGMATQQDVYFLLTLDDVNQYTYNWNSNLYSTAQNGPCAIPSCVFTDATARLAQQRMLRYIVARWGYSPNILSWELFNEINELEWSTDGWDWCQVVAWHQQMAQYIASIDAHQHLVNSSTGSFKTYGDTCGGAGSAPDLYATQEMKFAEMHFYYVTGCSAWAPSDPEGRDMADLTRYYAHLVYDSVIDKPAIIGEWGLLNSGWIDSPYLADDSQGVFLHQGIWSSAMSGMAATGLSWHWASYQDHDPAWWQQYLGIANFLANIDVANLTVLKPINVNFSLPYGSDDRPDVFASTNPNLRAMGLRNNTTVYLWIENTNATWWNAVQGISPAAQSGTMTFRGLSPGVDYAVATWDTGTGQVLRTTTITAQPDGSIGIPIHNLVSDVALKIRPQVDFNQPLSIFKPVIFR